MRALQEHIDRLGLKGRIEEIPGIPYFRTKFAVPDPPPLVSLLIPTRDRPDLLGPCIDSILTKTTYLAYEIVIIDNGSAEHDTFALFDRLRTDPRIRIVGYHHPFNYSAINNFGVAHVNGTILGLVNNDIEVLSSEWLDEMVSHAVRPEIGCVGAKLLYPDGCVQHGGVILGIGRVAGHSHRFFAGNDPGYFGRLQVAQNISAVTGACLVVRRSVYEEVGGFDERLTVAFNDVDFCLKVRSKGYLILWTPFALLIHRESSSRGGEDTTEKVARFNSEINVMRQRWRDVLDADPYYSRHLSVEHEDFRLKVN